MANEAKQRNEGKTYPAYYIFNNIEPAGGYVIVSSDQRFRDILGYNSEASFDPANLPDGLAYWLQFLEEEMTATDATAPSTSHSSFLISNSTTTSIPPLLNSCWSQAVPFNKQIPVSYSGDTSYGGHAAVGCVATALGEIMAYWRYPQQGQGGTHTNSNYTAATIDFSQQTYNWAGILDNYGPYMDNDGHVRQAYYNSDQADEVARLCYHIGVALDMNWNADNAGTSSTTNGKSLRALVEHFGYNRHAYLQPRHTLSPEAFHQLMLSELQAGRPVPFAGVSKSSDAKRTGHYFVLDGYDAAKELFHFNWGWQGVHNGYYALSALEPGTGGVGAGAGSYNYDQCALIGVQPTELYFDYAPAYSVSRYEVTDPTISRGNRAGIKAYGLTSNDATFTGTFGLAIYTQEGTLEAGNFGTLTGFNDGTSFEYIHFLTPTFNKFIPTGDHIMRLVARSEDGILYPIHATYGETESWTVHVTAGTTSRDPGTVTITPRQEIPASIQGVAADPPTLLCTEYYTLSGSRLNAPTTGIILRRDIYTDGTVKTQKVLH